MSKLLKQLVQVLDESGIQLKKINIGEDTINGEYSIEVNKEIMIIDRGGNYALYAEDDSVDKTYYISLTEALEVMADYLLRVKEGDILETYSGDYKVIKHHRFDLYNLLNEGTNRLLLDKGVKLNKIQKSIEEELFNLRR